MILARKVRLKPTKAQKQKLWQSATTARFIYNWTLKRQEENYKNINKTKEVKRLKKKAKKS
ncbi:putative transposase [Granulicatella balaenopterae]|uniref:Putative transposase n=1 Tax=Granulicatella balaenopterae TaxID=137733 RepID=A0A1H9LC68_9LACT|nr:helix-turn-helix domain-containing protein [Granulicatella balaenopterae]SER08745.1 putative transposase [Granulicatella balaenopterae]